jgi:hypothetical protein
MPFDFRDLGRSLAATVTFWANFYFDDHHLSIHGALFFKDTFKPFFEEAVKDKSTSEK